MQGWRPRGPTLPRRWRVRYPGVGGLEGGAIVSRVVVAAPHPRPREASTPVWRLLPWRPGRAPADAFTPPPISWPVSSVLPSATADPGADGRKKARTARIARPVTHRATEACAGSGQIFKKGLERECRCYMVRLPSRQSGPKNSATRCGGGGESFCSFSSFFFEKFFKNYSGKWLTEGAAKFLFSPPLTEGRLKDRRDGEGGRQVRGSFLSSVTEKFLGNLREKY